jgi:molybdenum cofactor cytidylyltransferase
MAETITGVLLAAGFSTRFGANKLLSEVDGEPLIARSAAALAPCDRIIVVVRDDEALMAAAGALGIDTVINPAPARGMGYSIACGVHASQDSRGWCILPADMPDVTAATTRQVVDLLRGGALISAPAHEGRRGHPVGFSAGFYDELAALDGDSGARGILERHASVLVSFATGDSGVLIDIDTP